MAYPVVIESAEKKAKLTLAGTVHRGDLIGYSSGWVEADCNVAAGPIFAQYIALNGGDSGQVIKGCKVCVLYDEDGVYTAEEPQYLSGTPGTTGSLTSTMPTTAGDLIQVVGRALDTKRIQIDIQSPKIEESFFEVDTFCTTTEPGIGTVDTGWTGPTLDADGEDAYIKGRFPCNMVALLQARILFNSIAMTAIDVDLTITGGYDDAANNQDTGAAQTTAGLDGGATDNDISFIDIEGASHLMDAAFVTPGRNWSVSIDMDGITGGTGMVLGVYTRCLVV